MFRCAVTPCAAICATALAAAAPPPAGAQPDRAAQERQAAEINARPDSPGSGRFPAIKEEVASLPRHVVYAPSQRWVEQGTVPERIEASALPSNQYFAGRTRPLCAYPAAARYKGSGSLEDGVNFTCAVK